jgi:3-isopropylmalate/(R)-2-methylmalate dehydratase small subunit
MMEAFKTLTAVAVPLDMANVDTDQIIPARFLARPRSEAKAGLFHDIRRDAAKGMKLDFPLNRPEFADARILVAGRNFGCGSSREHAVSVLVDNGFRAFVAPSFGDIFHNNCYQNGVLPIVVGEARAVEIRRLLQAKPGSTMAVDLAAQTLTAPDGGVDSFAIDSFRKDCLLNGVDDISFTLGHAAEIAAFEAAQSREVTWL